ncbi:death domain-associated protein 6-like isoform X2 [Oryza brachyantha]|uniref:death domain-associated protein 6-like isoform X2 n=1 Tax=Oryza brachyantha TaxID=4533 RepID=UPI001ADA607B|nr:death domain-associated protein 6-like isoform X2 [Oryza brachyantha]
MGCFLGCFGGAKERRRRRKRSPAQSPSGRARATPRLSPKKATAALDGDVVSAAAPLLATLLELRDSTDDLCLTVVKKKVTFDPNVTTYEAAAIPEEEEEEEEAEPAAGDDKDEARWMLGPDCAKSEAFPRNHRYSNYADSDNESEYDEDEEEEEEEEEEDEDGLDECAIDDEEEDGLLGIGRGEDEACESLFLLPMSKTKDSNGQEAAAGVTSPEPPPARQQTRDSNPVLGSVENLTQWKDAKTRAATAAPRAASDKENRMAADLLSEPAIPAKKKDWQVSSDYSPSTPSKQEISVDASLSTWLGSSGTPESNSVRSFSPMSREDRPILGALTVEDIKISSANSSPRRSRSPSPSPDDMPILGTVGAYWNCSSKAGDPVTRGGFMRTRTRFGQNFAG